MRPALSWCCSALSCHTQMCTWERRRWGLPWTETGSASPFPCSCWPLNKVSELSVVVLHVLPSAFRPLWCLPSLKMRMILNILTIRRSRRNWATCLTSSSVVFACPGSASTGSFRIPILRIKGLIHKSLPIRYEALQDQGHNHYTQYWKKPSDQ